MTLQYPSPAAFAQALRLRLQSTPASVPFVVVEGMSDRQVFGRMLDPRVKVVPSRGKEMVLGSWSHLSTDERARCTLVIDCDGRVDSAWLTCEEVIVSANRDLEADLVIELGVMQSVAQEFLAPMYDNGHQLSDHAIRLQGYVLEFTAVIGVLLDAARRTGLRTRVVDAETRQRRRVQVLDLPEAPHWLREYEIPAVEAMSSAIGSTVGWSEVQRQLALSEAVAGGKKLCRRHAAGDCGPCKVRRFSNGHDIVDVAAKVLSDHVGFCVSAGEVARAMRIAAGVSVFPPSWSVVERLSRRETTTGLRLLVA